MDKITGSGEHSTEIKIWPLENCRFAYTIGSAQPVRCSWISDQPLFYADYQDVADDEDYLLDDPVMEALERDIADLRDKTNAYDVVSREFAEPENHIQSLFSQDADFISTIYTASESNLQASLDLLHQSRLASQFISFAQLHGIEIRETSQIVDAAYDKTANAVLVRADLDMPTKVLLMVRELRRMWQHRNGAGLHPLSVHPDYAVLMNRAQQADLVVSMVRVAWELQLAGYKDAWVRVENSTLSDLGRAFAREAIADFRSINNGMAARATFESWFLSERCRKADRSLIQQMLADYQGYVFSDQVETSRLITLDVTKALGKMPFGTNYLEAVSTQIINDPVFTEVRDRSNANFLWFIKFERSFTEVENTAAVKEALKPETAEIISFPKKKSAKADAKATKANADENAEIIEIRRPVGE
ncbi:MAG: hypothetical protein A3J37_05350 [Alphaproteobacteria bacterium RIFCSPHIGHO2_12_FULL_45_9]|nr:MAG: hypothetical protein A3B66_10640 [Alphaproteobacteria bacterium RIFCSPHIGHO2_02_FULL_46_13]OFW99351.1 MAG: hypothetical protein A3J37_05350 [Alphaproteobacteria bacterium RIFCSPHIGHO2_12_FULL_45_9]